VKHSVYKRSEEVHSVDLEPSDVLAMLKLAGHVPADVERLESIREDDGALVIDWRIVTTSNEAL